MALKHRVVIRADRPWLRWGITAGAAVLLVLGAWGLYSYTRATTVSDFRAAQRQRDRLRQENRELGRQLRAAIDQRDTLRDQLAYLKSSRQIDEQACTLVKKSLASLQQDNSNLREQLAFYRGIVSPRESSEGLRIYDFKVDADRTHGRYAYDLLLVQVIHHDRRVSGKARVVFDGLQGGARKTYSLAQLTSDGDPLQFSFKYFQELDGDFKLPAGFRPLRVTVTLTPGGGLPQVENEYDWARITRQAQGAS